MTVEIEALSRMNPGETAERLIVLQRQRERLEETAWRIGRALCEQTLQHVVLVQLELDGVEHSLRQAGCDRFNKTRELLEQIASQLTCFSSELHPKVLEDLGLAADIEFLTQRFSKAAGIQIQVDSVMQKAVPRPIGLTLHEAVEEALTNIVRHSRATQACVRLREEAGQFTCAILDDGVGFDVCEVLAARGERGLGLIGIRDRARLSGGTVTIRSDLGHGTELIIKLPRAGKRTALVS